MAGPGAAARVPPAERGRTSIAERVVAKVASWAAREALSAMPEGLAGTAPTASVVVRSGAVGIRLVVELAYPQDIGRLCGLLRRQVADRVNVLTGMPVPEVVVQVERLHPHGQTKDQAGRVR